MTNGDDLVLQSPLPPDACCRLLGAKIDSEWAVLRRRPLVGRSDGRMLRARRRTFYNTAFQTYLVATLCADGEQTLIRCRFTAHPFAEALTALRWIGAVPLGAMTIASVIAFASGQMRLSEAAWTGIAMPAFVLAYVTGSALLVRYVGRDDPDHLLAIVCDTLQATPRA